MYVIGISAYYHDASVALFKDGELVFACEEEKFTGIKHDSSFPKNALNYIYRKYRIRKNEIDAVCYYENPRRKLERVRVNFFKNFFECPWDTTQSLLRTYRDFRNLKKELKQISNNVFYSRHHHSHIYYSYYSSPFDDCVVLSADGVGEWETMMVAHVKNGDFKIIPLVRYPHSLGLFYTAMTAYLGFRPNEGEYKVMGLAAYGNPKRFKDKIDNLMIHNCASLKSNMNYFIWDRSERLMFNQEMVEMMGVPNRLPEDEITQDHKDIAAAVQQKYETILFEILKDVELFTYSRNLALGGGCAYNGTANGKITTKTSFNNVWIPPCPSDGGSAVGACLHYFSVQKEPVKIGTNPFLGPEYPERDIVSTLRNNPKVHAVRYQTYNGLFTRLAKELHNGNIIGYYQGKIEFGARALGNRSILGNPTIPGMRDKINRVIKKREGFRPFAPMVPFNEQHKFFETREFIPYMNQVVKVRKEYVDVIPSTTHIDGTARIQSVTPHNRIYNLLKEFEKLSGVPILLNTSFNIKDKTIVLTPKDAMETFLNTEMDILVMGHYLIKKVEDEEVDTVD